MRPNKKPYEPLYCVALSAKRYALFNLDRDGVTMLRKGSAHGLGLLRAPYDERDLPPNLSLPKYGRSETGIDLWQHHAWEQIVDAALAGHPGQVAFDYHPAFQRPAVSRYGATSPHMLGWIKTWNAGKDYIDRIKPFGFLVSLFARSGPWGDPPVPVEVDGRKRGRPPKRPDIKPVAAFEADTAVAALNAFDRETGETIDPTDLKTYAEALAQFPLSTEDKFENGDFTDIGETRRRHVCVETFGLIGKEANRVGVSGEADPGSPAQVEF